MVVADELQILGDLNRGPNIEALCAVLRWRGWGQFVALTATVENPGDLAGWLNCHLTISRKRDVDLVQEIWYQGRGHCVVFGQTEGQDIEEKQVLQSSALDVARYLNDTGKGPVLVFTESRREASDFAREYSRRCERVADGFVVAEQLDLFSEPTEASEQLRENAEKKVAFHTADLSPQERQVIEKGFLDSRFEVCFATSTLAAGVNFPFKSVVFPKLTYQWGNRQGSRLPRSEYRNMSGRAGRLGMHEEGYAVLLPKNALELSHANKLVLPENDRIESQLVGLSMRRAVLMLVSSGIVDQRDKLPEFFENTLYWHLTLEKNAEKLKQILVSAERAMDWLLEAQFIEQHDGTLLATPFGKATSISGLLPTTATAFSSVLKAHMADLDEHFDEFSVGILHWVCSSDEFLGEHPSRFLPWLSGGDTTESAPFVSNKQLLEPLDRTNTKLIQCVHALALYIAGEAERKIRFVTNITAGHLNRLAINVAWILDGLHRIACVPDIGCSQQFANRLAMLSRRVRWGSPTEVLDIIRVAERHGVPGFGRQRAMALLQQELVTFDDILATPKERLVKILRSEPRTNALLAALSGTLGLGPSRLAGAHVRIGRDLGIESLIEDCNSKIGTDYEEAIFRLLAVETNWIVQQIDDGKRQNVPDILITLGDISVLIECKTVTKRPPLIKKEEAFAVLQKAADFDEKTCRVTLGKPAFDEHTKSKAQASSVITLVEHPTFMEGVLRVHTGEIEPKDFLRWIRQPGVSELDCLNGRSTYAVQ